MKRFWAAGWARLRPGSVARAESVLHACVRECAGYVAGLSRPPGPRRTALVAAIGALVVEHTAPEPDDGRTFEALLAVGRAALEAEDAGFARRVADTAVALRPRSRAAWRLRGEAAEADGRDKDALDAFERYEGLGGGDAAITQRKAVIRDKVAALRVAGQIVPEARLLQRPSGEVEEALTEAVQRRVERPGGAAEEDTRRLAAAYATYTRLAGYGRVEDVMLGGSEPLGIGPLRTQIKGRSVVVVGNGEAVAAGDLGEEIDAYDLIVRLDSFQTRNPKGTGRRLHLHAVSHRSEGGGWRQQAEIRLVFADRPSQWREAIRHRLVPGAQEYVGDKALIRPVRDPNVIGEPGWAADATTAFTVVRLLDFLDVSPRIDLVGLTQPGQLRPEERQWVLGHARRTEADGLRVALR